MGCCSSSTAHRDRLQPSSAGRSPAPGSVVQSSAPEDVKVEVVPDLPQRLDLPDGAGGAWRCTTLLSAPAASGRAVSRAVKRKVRKLDRDGRGEDAEMLTQCGRAGRLGYSARRESAAEWRKRRSRPPGGNRKFMHSERDHDRGCTNGVLIESICKEANLILTHTH